MIKHLFLALVLIPSALMLHAQGSVLTGTVTDSSGTRLLGISVYQEIFGITNPGFNVSDSTVSDSFGTYFFGVGLPAGTYWSNVYILDCSGSIVSRTDTFVSPDTLINDFDFCSNSQGSSCAANFSISNQGGGTYNFTDNSFTVGPPNQVGYSWDFGDGNTDIGQNPSHTYQNPGTYNVCLTVVDFSTNCTSTTCRTINFLTGTPSVFTGTLVDSGGFPLFNQVVLVEANGINGNNNFDADSVLTDSLGNYFLPLSLPNGDYAINISFLDCDGTYKQATDSITAPDTLVTSLTYCGLGSTSCNANFLAFNQGNGTFFFQEVATGIGSQSSLSFDWDFGDGNTATGSQVSHTYNSFGIYTVCMVLRDSTFGCSDTVCQSVDNSQFNPTNCDALLFYIDNGGGSFTFKDSSTLPNDTVQYHFFFGDGTDSLITSALPSRPSVNHQYSNSGLYYPRLEVSSVGGCFDTTSTVVFFNGPGSSCGVSFVVDADTNNQNPRQIDYRITGGNSFNYDVTWDFGDGNTGFGQFGSHVYAQSGTYEICMSAIDTVNLCTDTVCKTLVMGSNPGGSCVASAVYQVNSAGVNFTSNAIASSSAFYGWDFGDGTSGNGYDLFKFYTANGTYSVIHYVIEGNCTDTVFFDVTINSYPNVPDTLGIDGNVSALDSNIVFNNGLVYLIRVDSTPAGPSLTAVDTASIIGNYYRFADVDTGEYLVKAALNPSSPFYANYFPTYHSSFLFWDTASVVWANGQQGMVDIQMIPGNNPGGPGFIGGLVSQGANKMQGDPLDNIQVILFTDAGDPVAYTYTDINGAYEFDNLALGAYEIHVEVFGLNSDDINVVLDQTNPNSLENDLR